MRAFEERARLIRQDPQLALWPRGHGPCLCRTRHPFAVSSRCRPSQVIEFVFAANPETTRREPQKFPSPSRVAAGLGSLLAVDLFVFMAVAVTLLHCRIPLPV